MGALNAEQLTTPQTFHLALSQGPTNAANFAFEGVCFTTASKASVAETLLPILLWWATYATEVTR